MGDSKYSDRFICWCDSAEPSKEPMLSFSLAAERQVTVVASTDFPINTVYETRCIQS